MSTDWRTIPTHPAYEVNCLGEVRRKSDGFMPKVGRNAYGSAHVRIVDTTGYDPNVQVARMVGMVFCDDFRPDYRVRYINGDRADCRASNLKFVPPCEVAKPSAGDRNGRSKMNWEMVIAVRDAPNESNAKLAKRLGISPRSIQDVRSFRSWEAKARTTEQYRERAMAQSPRVCLPGNHRKPTA